MKTRLWLLDVNYEVKNDVPEIWLWGIDESGKRILVIDRNFLDYFYIVVEEGANADEVVKEIGKAHYPLVERLEVVERKFFGKPIKAVKVYCKNPDDIIKYAKVFRKLEGVKDCFEDDIRSSMR
ncbi:MAG: 3'-5' exonuclease, partial [Candidatus Bathyarchaeia archaeon]